MKGGSIITLSASLLPLMLVPLYSRARSGMEETDAPNTDAATAGKPLYEPEPPPFCVCRDRWCDVDETETAEIEEKDEVEVVGEAVSGGSEKVKGLEADVWKERGEVDTRRGADGGEDRAVTAWWMDGNGGKVSSRPALSPL